MSEKIPMIIQGGMGAGVSGWLLARTVSRMGQLGVVAGTALDEILSRRLQDGDPGGHAQRALQQFPMQQIARRILDQYYIPGGKTPETPYLYRKTPTVEGRRESQEMCIAGNFVEIFLAMEGHEHPVAINYLEKIQLPHLPSLYGALLAGVAVVIMGAGIPLEIPDAIEALCNHQPANYNINVTGTRDAARSAMHFDPRLFSEGDAPPPLKKPAFLPIISSDALANVLLRKTGGRLDGFIVEGNLAGGHNAPPRGATQLTADGQPIYGERDNINLEKLRAMGKPFWLAGAQGTPEGLRAALDKGAAGIQVGTAFALCRESALASWARTALVKKALAGQAKIFTDPVASPTGFPFKVAVLDDTLSQKDVYEARKRVCDLGFLRETYLKEDGKIGYRCSAEPVDAYVAKGGDIKQTVNRKCLCNALLANIDLPQILPDGSREKCLVTLGDDFINIGRFCDASSSDYSAEDVISVLLKGC